MASDYRKPSGNWLCVVGGVITFAGLIHIPKNSYEALLSILVGVAILLFAFRKQIHKQIQTKHTHNLMKNGNNRSCDRTTLEGNVTALCPNCGAVASGNFCACCGHQLNQKKQTISSSIALLQTNAHTTHTLRKELSFRLDRESVPIRDLRDIRDNMQEFVVLDTETTGLTSADKPVEISILHVRNWAIVDRFHTLINPHRHISFEASQINHISDSMVMDAPDFCDIADDVRKLIEGRVVVGHNISFDLRFLEASFDQTDPPIHVWYADTIQIAKSAFPGLISYKLDYLLKHFCICDEQTHRAADDTDMTYKLLCYCKAEFERVAMETYVEANVQYNEPKTLEFAGKIFVLTGQFRDYSRSKIVEMIEIRGGTVSATVTKKTDYVVVAYEDKSVVKDAVNAKSTKIIKAEEVRRKGGKIHIISDEFFIAQLGIANTNCVDNTVIV